MLQSSEEAFPIQGLCINLGGQKWQEMGPKGGTSVRERKSRKEEVWREPRLWCTTQPLKKDVPKGYQRRGELVGRGSSRIRGPYESKG